MRTLYLHAGLPKTGTTYLQTILALNRDRLLDAGIGLGPHFDPEVGSHRALFTTTLQKKGVAQILRETAACPGDTLLVSFEGIERLMQTPSAQGGGRLTAHDFQDAARGLLRLRLVIFVRRQDFLAESNYAQAVKSWYTGGIDAFDGYIRDLDSRLKPLEEIFGRENLLVRLFPDGGPHDLLATLFETMDSDLAERLARPVAAQNVSMHRRKLLFLSQVPKNAQARYSLPRSEVPRLFTRVLDRSDAIADDGGRYMMSPAARHALVAAHQAGNRALVQRHGIADPGPFVELPDAAAPWLPPAPITPQERRAVFGEVLRAARRRRNPVAALQQSAGVALAFTQMQRSG